MPEFAVVVAGGSGTRMGSSVPKQFLLLKGMPVVMHTLKQFFLFRPEMRCIVVLPEHEEHRFQTLFREYLAGFDMPLLAKGGKTRSESVLSGLQVIQETFKPKDAMVAVHDAVRPLFSCQTFEDAMHSAHMHGCGIPVVPVNETVRILNPSGSELVNRDALRLIQTPQCFMFEELLHSYAVDANNSYTDDASVWEASGRSLYFTNGNPENIKITRPGDLALAEYYLEKGI